MHIPPYHKKKRWQRFIIGACFGLVIAYCIFMYMYGVMYEKLLAQNLNLQSQVYELKSRNDSLLQDKKDMDEKASKPFTVETLDVTISNREQMEFDRLATHQLEELIKQEISHVIGSKVEIISESSQLLIATIENRPFTVDDFSYYFEVYKLTISENVKVNVKAKLTSSS